MFKEIGHTHTLAHSSAQKSIYILTTRAIPGVDYFTYVTSSAKRGLIAFPISQLW